MRRLLSRLVLVPLALLFLFEAWLWDRLAPVVARLVAAIPLRRLRAWLHDLVVDLSPTLSLLVFAVPAALLFPLKLLGLWLLGQGQLLLAGGVIVLAKLVGMGVTAFLFDLTRPKLLQLAWFRAVYETVLRWRAAAHALVQPTMDAIRRRTRLVAPGRAQRAWRLFRRVRRVVSRRESA